MMYNHAMIKINREGQSILGANGDRYLLDKNEGLPP